jgi:peptidoglycan DL-endopeptidase CwlO
VGLRLLGLLALTGVACYASAASAAHDAHPHPRGATRLPALPARSESATGRCPIPSGFRPAFVHAAQDSGLQLSMLVAVAQVESEFRPNAHSAADARGLMQVVPRTAAELSLDADVPSSNVLAGARYLKQMLDRFQRADLALAAYNAGPTIVDRLGRAPNGESLSYVANVERRWAGLAGCS